MNKVKIAHIADVHLGSTFANLPYDMSKQRSKEITHTFINILKSCSTCDIVLLSGDIFDSGTVPVSVIDLFLETVSSLENVRFFYSCGNHDSYYTNVIKYCLENAPENLHIFLPDKISYVTIPEHKTRIYGVSFSAEHQYDPLINTLPDCDNDYINILCMHADTGSEQYNPLDITDLDGKNLDYAALGHIHSFSDICRADKCFYAYPGIPEGRAFDEYGPKGYIAGNICKNSNDLKFYESSKRIYIDETIDITDFYSEYEIADSMNALCLSSDNICRFNIVGTNNLKKAPDIKFLEKNCNCYYCICIDKTKSAISLEEYAGYPGLLGSCACETVRLVNRAQSEDEKELYKKSFELLIDIFEKN